MTATEPPTTAEPDALDDAHASSAPSLHPGLRRRTRQLDAEARAWERDLFIGGPVAVLVWRPESRWPVCHASPNAARIFGYSAEQMTGPDFHYMSLIHLDDVDRIAGEVVRYLNEGRDTWEQRYRIVRPDGRTRRLYDFTVVDRDDSGSACLLRGYVMDETETLHREHDFQMLAEAIADAVWISEAHTGQLSANPAARRLTGHDAAQLRAMRWADLIAPRDRARLTGLLERLERGESVHDELWMRRPDLTEVLVDLRLQPLGDGRALGIGRDRTEQRASETRLQTELGLMHTLIRAIPDLIWLKDPDGVYLACNPRFEAFFGATESEIVGHTDHDFVAREQADFFRRHDLNALRAGRPTSNEELITFARDGHQERLETIKTPMYAPDGRLIGILGVGRDVTESRQAQEGLRESQELYSAIVNQAADGIVLIDAKTLRFVEFNDAACQSLGYSRTEFAQLGIPDIQAELSPRGIALWRDRINSTGQGDFETRHRHKNGELRHVLVSNRLLSIRQGRYWAAIWRDITERKRIEAELDEHRRHLEELVRTRTAELERARLDAESANLAKSILLANMSHEVRVPINTVIGLTHRLKASAGDHEQSRRLDQISEAGYHLLRVANDILDLSRIEAGRLRLECVDFELRHSLARLNLLLAAEIAAKGLSLRLIIDPTLPARLHGDPLRLGQILLNLTSNAVKFSDYGTVTVRANPVERAQGRFKVRFEVQDEGVGIPESRQGTLFLAFEQRAVSTARQLGGSGLGLAISQRLVELMDGEIGVESQLGVGSTFWFTAWFGLAPNSD